MHTFSNWVQNKYIPGLKTFLELMYKCSSFFFNKILMIATSILLSIQKSKSVGLLCSIHNEILMIFKEIGRLLIHQSQWGVSLTLFFARY